MSSGQIKSELWKRGVLSWKLHKGQKVIDDSFNNVSGKLFVCNCSRRFGKTYWGVVKAFETAIQKKKARVVIASAFKKDVEEFILPIALSILEDCPKKIKPVFNKTKTKFQFKNGSQILIVGLDKNPNAGRGQYCDLYLFEEAAFISEDQFKYIYSSVVMPMTMNRDGAKVVMITTPPKSPSHPFKEFVEKAELENAYVKLTIFDNPLVTQETIQTYKNECLIESDWKREYLCEFVIDTASAVIPEFNELLHVKESTKDSYNKFYHRYVGMDLGSSDFTAVIFGYYDYKNAILVIEDEITINGPELTLPKLKELIANKELEHFGDIKPYKRIADNSDPILLGDLGSTYNLHFQPVHKDSVEAMVNELRVWVSQGKIQIHPRCKMLIGCLKYAIWNKQRSSFARSTTYKHFDHLDALKYLLRSIDLHSNPVPATHGVSPHTHWIPSLYEESQQVSELKKIFGR